MDWTAIAKALPVSHSQRINCWKCGGKKTASVTNMGSHYVVHCFRCKEKEHETPPPMTAAERLALRRAADEFKAAEPTIPDDFTTDIPIPGLLWLSKGGLHLDDIKSHAFGWSDTLGRVVMPVYEQDVLVAVQARRVGDGYGPKYLGQVHSGPRPVFKCEKNAGNGTIVLTEDILSACRVGKVANAWSLLGTALMPAVINRIAASSYTDIVIWMDDDTAGHNARKKMLRQLGAVGIHARSVISDRDPKHHTLEEMEELIWPTHE